MSLVAVVTVVAVAVAPSVGVSVLPPASLAVVGRCPAHCPAPLAPPSQTGTSRCVRAFAQSVSDAPVKSE